VLIFIVSGKADHSIIFEYRVHWLWHLMILGNIFFVLAFLFNFIAQKDAI